MRPVEFTPDLVSGVDDIDSQHRTLFEQTNRFLSLEEDQDTRRQERAMLDFLFGYAHYHLAAEEALMRHAGIDFGAHADQHDKLRQEVQALHRVIKKKGFLAKEHRAHLHFLIEFWFANHIRYWDLKMVQALRRALAEPTLPLPEKRDLEGLWNDIDPDDVEVADLAGQLTQYEIKLRKQKT